MFAELSIEVCAEALRGLAFEHSVVLKTNKGL
jgi:hypothetical protein